MTMDSAVGTQPMEQGKKRRNPNSCDLCKRKKIKCDSAQMPDNRCSECVSYGCECVRSGSKRYGNWKPSVVLPRPWEKSASPSIASGGSRGSSPSLSTSSAGHSASSSTLHPFVSAAITLLPPPIDPLLTTALTHISSHIFALEKVVSELRAINVANTTALTKTSGNKRGGASFEDVPIEDENPDDGVEELDKLTMQFTDMHIKSGKQGQGKHFGPSSNISLIGMALKVMLDSNSDPSIIQNFRGIRRPLYWNTLPWEADLQEEACIHEFPPLPLMHKLIDIYFKEINATLPLLHKGLFLKSIRENQHILNPAFGEVVLGVISCGSRWCPDPSVLLEADGVGHSAGWRYFRQIRLFRKMTSKTASVFDLQSTMLAVIYLGGSSQVEISWTLIGMGMRFAVELGAHRKRTQSPIDSELWKRAFWIIWLYDGLMSSHVGRCRSVPSDEFDVELPIECDDEYWDFEAEDAEHAFRQPPGQPSDIAGFIGFIKYISVLEKAQEQLFSAKASRAISSGRVKASAIVAQLSDELDEWYRNMPEHLKWTQYRHHTEESADKLTGHVSTHFKQAAMLECGYHHMQILIHRPFIFFSKPESAMFKTSWAKCTVSANKCVGVFKSAQPFLGIHVGLLGIVTILILEKWKVGIRSKTSRESVSICLKCVERVEHRWYGAGRLTDVIRELMYVDELVSYSNASPESSGSSPAEKPNLRPDEIFSMTTTSWPTFDMDFLGRKSVPSDDDPFAMLF